MGTLTVVEKVSSLTSHGGPSEIVRKVSCLPSYRGPSDLRSQVLKVEFAALVEAQVRQHLLVLQHLPLYRFKQEELIQEV